MPNALRFLRMVRHVPLTQLLARARLMAQRRAEISLPFIRKSKSRRQTMALSADPLGPIFPARTGRIVLTGDHAVFRFLGTEETSPIPIDWRPRKFQKGTRLWLLNLHYMEYLEELDDSQFLRIILDWIDQTPPWQPGFWRDNWNSFSLSIRVVVWMQQLVLRGLATSAPERVIESLRQQLLFLERHLETDIGGNHLMKNIKALLWAGRFFTGPEAARMHSSGEALLRKELGQQIHGDGMHFELTPAYHRQVFADLLEMRTVLTDRPLQSALEEVLESMAEALVHLTHPDGELAQFGDTAMDSDYPVELLLKHWHSPGPALNGAWELPSGGFAGFRSDSQYFIIRTGKIAADELPAHAHGDNGSFEWSVDGHRIIVDAGVYEYDPGERRRWSRSTEAHNTVTVNGADQAEFWGSFRVGR
ncbi:MAG: alginate lyase family protein, partial [Acidobacteriota bacterium]